MTTTCKELVEFLLKYLEDDLPAPQRAEFQKHLDACASCRNYLETYRETIRLSRCCMCEGPNAPKMPEALVAAILNARKQQ